MAVEQANVKGWGKTPFVEERSAPRPECENPDRWTAIDQVTAEVEVLKFIRSLVRTVKPKSVVVCGDPSGELSRFVGHALRENGFGNMVICGYTDEAKDKIIGRVMGSGLGRWTTILEDGAMDTGSELEFVVVDGGDIQKGIDHFFSLLKTGGLLVVHDATEVSAMDSGQAIQFPTPRGLMILQRK